MCVATRVHQGQVKVNSPLSHLHGVGRLGLGKPVARRLVRVVAERRFQVRLPDLVEVHVSNVDVSRVSNVSRISFHVFRFQCGMGEMWFVMYSFHVCRIVCCG